MSGAPGMSCLLRPVFSGRRPNLCTAKLLKRTLVHLHSMHQGMKKMEYQAREAVYWPGINADIVDYVKRCPICTKHKASLLAQPMLPQDIPDGLWQEITAHYFTHKGRNYLLVCDLFSKDLFLYKVTSKSALFLSQKLQELIAQYGPPTEFTLTMALLLHPKILNSSCNANTLTTPPPPPLLLIQLLYIMAGQDAQDHLQSQPGCQNLLRGPIPRSVVQSHQPKDALPREILHNRTIQCLGRPSMPIDIETVQNHLISKKAVPEAVFQEVTQCKATVSAKPLPGSIFPLPSGPQVICPQHHH